MSPNARAASTRALHSLGLAATLGCGALLAPSAQAGSSIDFPMVRTKGLPHECAEHARATVHVDTTPGFTERLVVDVSGFKPGTALVLFTIQKPNAPFGIGWYQGDIAIGPKGSARETFVTRANVETFAVAPAAVPAPKTHPTDQTKNPAFKPIHTYHLGIWFDSVADAVANHCPATVTAFNGDHTAGPQVLNTGGFKDLAGPLSQID